MNSLSQQLLASVTLRQALHVLVIHLRRAPHAASALRELIHILQTHSELRAHCAALLHHWLQHAALYTGFVQSGIYSRHGFFRELKRRLYDRLNPPPRDDNDLGDLLQSILRPADLHWLSTISPLQWLRLYRQLHHERSHISQHHVRDELLYAAEMLSLWIAAEDLDPDLIRLDPRLLLVDSPFISLQREIQQHIDAMRAQIADPDHPLPDSAPIAVMFAQSRDQVARLKRLGSQNGASLATAHLLERLEQSLDRLESILAILDAHSAEKRARHVLALISELIQSGLEQHRIKSFIQSASGMLSKSISASKSHHGEHYITTTKRDYRHMFLSAAGAGVIIACMALIKIQISRWHLPPFWETVCVSLNYGLGFILVHLLGFTIATKQPAMTAATIAATIEQGQHQKNLEKPLAHLLIAVNRSQSIAALGNLSVAMLSAALITLLYQHWRGVTLLSADEVSYHLAALKPVPALWYAAIAALWLFCAGIISGFYDNRATYLRLEERLAAHPGLAFLGETRRARLARYLHHNFGALHGNFAFGMLLGVTPFIGDLLALPLDIRHIAFSSANLSYSAISGEIAFSAFALGLLYVLMIGLVNLWASFLLALRVALRARDSHIPSVKKLLRALASEIRARPLHLFWPPREDSASAPDKKSG